MFDVHESYEGSCYEVQNEFGDSFLIPMSDFAGEWYLEKNGLKIIGEFRGLFTRSDCFDEWMQYDGIINI